MGGQKRFVCERCGQRFDVSAEALARYPGWTPKRCLRCRDASRTGSSKPNPQRKKKRAAPGNLTLAQVLLRYTDGPKTGIFTDGSAQPNPGPGGWGVVYVQDDRVVRQKHGQAEQTTNNRMELTALIEGYQLAPEGTELDCWTDSELCFKTMTEWAPGWKQRGWRRKAGEIKNLDLVKQLYALVLARPEIRLRWIAAHSGKRWNEYADSLSTAWARDEL
ncbi:MAG: ribonuclease HI [Deltaproteobacteria bacterium]|nr:ribonuclease HI [Deltaproteobacteria bacterium]